jgi:hypothetical protein
MEEFDGDDAVEPGVGAAPHRAHAARGQALV